VTDPVRTPDEILQDDETAWPKGRAPKQDNETSDLDAIIEENTSVNGTDPDAR
jgi:hypothetical protein